MTSCGAKRLLVSGLLATFAVLLAAGVSAKDEPVRKLKVVRGSGQPSELVIPNTAASTFRIGRRVGDNDIVFPERSISRRHAVVSCNKGSCSISDVGTEGSGSMNGTQVNGVRLQPNTPVPIKPGDRIELSTEAEIVVQ